MSIAGQGAAQGLDAPGRPIEIELWSNRALIHPLSHALVDRLAATAVSPNAVSAAGALTAAMAALAYALLPWPGCAFIGLALHFAWHVLDGADGDLARRTGRASPLGELIDGICDHVGQGCLYVAFAVLLSRQLGPGAWALALIAAASRAAQASAYEAVRRAYRRWVYGAVWIKQSLAAPVADTGGGGLFARAARALGRVYVALSAVVSADDGELEPAMAGRVAEGGDRAAAARDLYRRTMLPIVKRAGWLSANLRTLVAFLSLLAGSPIYYFAWEILGLNAVLAGLIRSEGRSAAVLVATLQGEAPTSA